MPEISVTRGIPVRHQPAKCRPGEEVLQVIKCWRQVEEGCPGIVSMPEYVMQDFAEVGDFKWFGDYAAETVLPVFGHNRIIGITA